MKTLIVYYSRSSHTKKVAEEIRDSLSADIEEIRETQSRDGFVGYLNAAKDAVLKKDSDVIELTCDPKNYDLVIIGTPVFAFNMAGAVRSFLNKYGKEIKEVAFFATMGGSGDKRTFANMKELCRSEPFATASFIDKEIVKGTHQENLKHFVNLILEHKK